MSTELAAFQPENIPQAMELAKTLSVSALLPQALRQKPGDVLIILMTGRELGLAPMQAIRGLNVIEGKVAMSADMMVALAVRRREVCEYFRLVESTDKKATYTTKRVGSDPVTISFTIEEAQRAGLTGKTNWKNYPAAMLRARAASALARAVYPDMFLGIYDPDEAEEIGEERTERDTNAPPPPPGLSKTQAVLAKVNERVEQLKKPEEAEIVQPPAPVVTTQSNGNLGSIVSESINAPPPSPPKTKKDRQPNTFDGKPIPELSAEDLAKAISASSEWLTKHTSGKAVPSVQQTMADLQAERERRIALTTDDREPGADDDSAPF